MSRFTRAGAIARAAVFAAAWIASAGGLAAQPLPPARPPDLGLPDIRLPDLPEMPAPVVPPPAVGQPPLRATIDQGEACRTMLTGLGLVFESAASPPSKADACRIENPVRLISLRSAARGGQVITLPDRPVVECRLAGPFGRWLGDVVAPLVQGHLATELKAVRTGPGYDCRNRNRARSGKLSAHATGLAVDIARIEFANGDGITVGPNLPPRQAALFAALRTAACGWFTTILGPGSDAAHADHLHLDIMQHGSSDRYRICQ